MKRSTAVKLNCTLLLATGFVSLGVQANEGPYVGTQWGINSASDQTYKFAGSSTAVVQLIAPPELPQLPNSGNAEKLKYGTSILGSIVVGDALTVNLFGFGLPLRPEFDLALRRENPNSVTLLQPKQGDSADASPKGVRLSTTTGFFNLWFDVFRSWKVHPYFGGGFGVMRNILNGATASIQGFDTTAITIGPETITKVSQSGATKADDTRAAYQFGGGIAWDVWRGVTVGLDYRHVESLGASKFYAYPTQPQTYLAANYKAQSYFFSIKYYFITPAKAVEPPPPAPAPEVVPVEEPKDSDGDGVIDPIDQCPDTPAGTQVDEKGCPLPPPPPPAPTCKTPGPGEKISLAGCGTGDQIVLRGVNFDTNKATLTVNARTLLNDVAAELNAYPTINVEVDGHTDSRGSAKLNEGLSQRRAASVKTYLSQHGVAASRMTSAGFGPSKPIADNGTDEGRELNRRVELKIVSGTASSVTVVPAAPAAAAVAAPAEAPAAEPAPVDAPAEAAPADAPAQ